MTLTPEAQKVPAETVTEPMTQEQAIASLLPSQGGVVPQASTTKVGAAPGR